MYAVHVALLYVQRPRKLVSEQVERMYDICIGLYAQRARSNASVYKSNSAFVF